MAGTGTSSQWVREMSALTVASPPAEAGEALVARLHDLAGAMALACPPGHSPCALAGVTGGSEACAVAHRLVAAAPSTRTARSAPDRAALLSAYLEAVVAAAAAVRACRRTEHPSGRCWFDPAGSGTDVCGAVLAAAHRIGGRPA